MAVCPREEARLRQDAWENRERVLAAAEEVFGAAGASASTDEVARRAGVGIATVFRHFPTKEALIEATLLRHFDHLTERAHDLAAEADPGEAWRALLRTMITTGATKLTLISLLTKGGDFPRSAAAASDRLKAAVNDALLRAQSSGAVRPSVTIDEVYVLIRGLAQASATMPTAPSVLDRAVDIVIAGTSASRSD